MTTNHKIIELKGVNASYECKTVLTGVNLTVRSNDFLGIIGPNGGGKTTLMKIVLGLKQPSSGEVKYFCEGKEVSHIDIGYLPQYNQMDRKFPISVRDVVLSGLNSKKSLYRPFTKKHHELCDEAIERMGLTDLTNRQFGELSGGQRQRTLLARAITSKPSLLILDEPNTYIDPRSQVRLYELLSEINKECAIMLVSHDMGSIMKNVKSIACVDGTLHYHPDSVLPVGWLEGILGYPMDIVAHGPMPHRVLRNH